MRIGPFYASFEFVIQLNSSFNSLILYSSTRGGWEVFYLLRHLICTTIANDDCISISLRGRRRHVVMTLIILFSPRSRDWTAFDGHGLSVKIVKNLSTSSLGQIESLFTAPSDWPLFSNIQANGRQTTILANFAMIWETERKFHAWHIPFPSTSIELVELTNCSWERERGELPSTN